MKLREINEQPRWTYWVPDSIADWDAPSHWERERLASMEEHLKPGMVLYDVGTEHGWLSAVYGGFVGYENMVLIEPSPEFWPNIRKIWECNGFPEPLAAFQGFIGDQADPLGPGVEAESIWPACSVGPECGAMAYRYLGTEGINTRSIDQLAGLGFPPDAVTIDIEGAELLALWGAEGTLRHHRPLVWVSVHEDLMRRDFSLDPLALHRFMESVGYLGEYLVTDHEAHWLFMPKESL